MRKVLLAAAVLSAGHAVPASAAIRVYGLGFLGEYVSASPDDQFYLASQPKDFNGYFVFDDVNNRLLEFEASFLQPGDSLTQQAVSLFNAAGSCDLQCFIGSLEAGSFFYDYGSARSYVEFGSPISGTAYIAPRYFPPRPITVAGSIRFQGSVPEPTTWLMMLVGFGAIGWSMRRQRRAQVALAMS